jgi:NADPH:quinone reductase-like Zn-dependent oxidoreductase
MKAMMLKGLDTLLEPALLPDPVATDGQVVVHLSAAALNKRDYWITKGKYPGLSFPLVLGSDGVGKVGNMDVIINPSLDWGPDNRYFGSAFRILGMPEYGTLAEQVLIPESNLYDKPAHLTWTQAAAIPVCGVTAYRAMFTRGRARQGERMLISGIGGGVASMALLFGVAAGLDVWVTSSGDHKIDLAIQYGASGGANYTRPHWEKELMDKVNDKFDLVIDGAGGDDFARLLPMMHPAGRIVVYGGTRGIVDGFSPQRVFWKQLDILGSTMGSPEDFNNMLSFINTHKIVPIVSHVFPLSEINDAMAVIAKGDQFGKVCIEIP